MKHLGKKVVAFTAVSIMSVGAFTVTAHAALLGWDLVDSGKHLDWDSDTKYVSTVKSGTALWEGYRSGVIREDSLTVIQDVFISDYNEVTSTMAYTNSNGQMMFKDYHFSDMNANQRLKTVTHEFGHALGLDHTSGKNDIMQQGKLEITALSETDKKSYDEAYDTY